MPTYCQRQPRARDSVLPALVGKIHCPHGASDAARPECGGDLRHADRSPPWAGPDVRRCRPRYRAPPPRLEQGSATSTALARTFKRAACVALPVMDRGASRLGRRCRHDQKYVISTAARGILKRQPPGLDPPGAHVTPPGQRRGRTLRPTLNAYVFRGRHMGPAHRFPGFGVAPPGAKP